MCVSTVRQQRTSTGGRAIMYILANDQSTQGTKAIFTDVEELFQIRLEQRFCCVMKQQERQEKKDRWQQALELCGTK